MAHRRVAHGDRAERALSFDVRIRSLSAAYFERAQLADWLIATVVEDPPDVRVLKRLIPKSVRLLDKFQPTTLVVPKVGPGGARRSANVQKVLDAVCAIAQTRGISVVPVSNRQLRESFSRVQPGAGKSKNTRNEIVAKWFPELAGWRPKPRRAWEPEQYTTALFDAVGRWCAWRGVPSIAKGR